MRLTVGVADMKVSGDAGDLLITHALGSCLGLTVFDPVAGVGGLLHVMLPLSTIDPEKAIQNPFTFVDTGVPRLFLECYRLGAVKQRMAVKVAGGAFVHRSDVQEDFFEIGKRNIVMLRKLLWRNGVLLAAEDVGGSVSRTLSLQISTGQVLVRTNGETREL